MTGYTDPDLLPFPDDYNQPADVPADLEALAQAVETLMNNQKDLIALQAPIGAIMMWPQASAPQGWHLCNGTAHGSPQLQTLLGSPNTPNLVDRFVVAAGNLYGLNTVGGEATVLLTEQQSGLRNHSHGASAAGVGDHAHPSAFQFYSDFNNVNQDGALAPFGTGPRNVTVYGAGTAQDSGAGAHSHGVSVAASGAYHANQAHNNMPPFYGLTYIIRKG